MASYFGEYADCLAILGAVSACYVALTFGRWAVRVVWRMIGRQLSVDLKQYGPWAALEPLVPVSAADLSTVVTGCTDGIGKSFALQLAEKGMDIVLISRNPQKLSALAEQIVAQYKVSVKVVTADFRETDIYDNIKQQLSGLDVGVLVNNVGIMNRRSPGFFCEADDFEQFNRDIVNVNVLSCVMMTGIVLPEMLERKRGAIINMSSSASLRPTAFFSIYSATKVFIRYFSEALNMEYSPHGITIQVLTPSLVQSSMAQLVAKSSGFNEGLIYPTSQRFVRTALNTLGRESSTAAYWPHELKAWAISMMSDSIFGRVLLHERDKMAEMLKKE